MYFANPSKPLLICFISIFQGQFFVIEKMTSAATSDDEDNSVLSIWKKPIYSCTGEFCA